MTQCPTLSRRLSQTRLRLWKTTRHFYEAQYEDHEAGWATAELFTLEEQAQWWGFDPVPGAQGAPESDLSLTR